MFGLFCFELDKYMGLWPNDFFMKKYFNVLQPFRIITHLPYTNKQ